MKASENAIGLVKMFEGFSEKPYEDIVGKMTIGYGHLIKPGESFPEPLTGQDAEELLANDLCHAEDCINTFVDEPLTQNQFDALVSFIFNLGCQAFKGSTLCGLINQNLMDSASKQFLRWDHAGGKKIPGLTRRRVAEQAMFNS